MQRVIGFGIFTTGYRALSCAALLLGAASCGSDVKPSSSSCTLDESVRFEFTEVTFKSQDSTVIGGISPCPEFDADTLNGQLDAGADACETEINEAKCRANVTCDFAGVTVTGIVAEADKGYEGRFRVDDPIVCVYDVKARRVD